MQRRIGDQPHCNGTGMPATGDQAAKVTLRRRCRIGVKPLRVIGICELAYLGLAEGVRPGLDGLPCLELGELHAEPNRGTRVSRSAIKPSRASEPAKSIISSAGESPRAAMQRFNVRPPASHADATMG